MNSTVATSEKVARLAKGWSREIVKCRTRGHAWELVQATYIKKDHRYIQALGCTRCLAAKEQELNEAGKILSSTTWYQKGYLVKGLGRLGAEGKGVLRIHALINSGLPVDKGER
jgi:hypothetical protein